MCVCHCSFCCVSVMLETAPWPLLTSLMHAHWPSMDSFHRVTCRRHRRRERGGFVLRRSLRQLAQGKPLTLLSPPETARMFPVMDQLTCQTTSLNLCSSLAVHVFPAGSSHVQMNTRPSCRRTAVKPRTHGTIFASGQGAQVFTTHNWTGLAGALGVKWWRGY